MFLAFICAKEIGNLLSIWFGVNIFSPFPCWFLLCAADYLLSKSGMSVVSGCSFDFSWLIFDSTSLYSLPTFSYWLRFTVKIEYTNKRGFKIKSWFSLTFSWLSIFLISLWILLILSNSSLWVILPYSMSQISLYELLTLI